MADHAAYVGQKAYGRSLLRRAVPSLAARAWTTLVVVAERSFRRTRGHFARHVRREAALNRQTLERSRAEHPSGWTGDPLVSVLIPTFNRGRILCERTIPSVLGQTYPNLELIVVGDCCTDDTAQRITAIQDPRLRFVNLEKRGEYPKRKFDRWRVAGVVPANHALSLARGDWTAPLDDDDEFTPDHIEVLLREAQRRNLEMVYGKVRAETSPGRWRLLGSWPPRETRITRIAMLCHAALNVFPYDLQAWRFSEPADWNVVRRMRDAGVRIGFVDKVVGIHHREGTQRAAASSAP